MAVLSDAQQQALIAAELNQSGVTAFEAHVALYWTFYEPESVTHPRLRYLLVKRDAIKYLLGRVTAPYDITEGDTTEKRSQLVDYYEGLAKQAEEQIVAVYTAISGGRGGKIGQITRQAPILREDQVEVIEGTDRAYRGDVWRRT